MFLHFYLLYDILLQSEQASEAEIHPQLNRAPSQAADSSPTKKVRPMGRCLCDSIVSAPTPAAPQPGLLGSLCKSVSLSFQCPDLNVNDPAFLEPGFFVRIGVLMVLGPALDVTDSFHFLFSLQLNMEAMFLTSSGGAVGRAKRL